MRRDKSTTSTDPKIVERRRDILEAAITVVARDGLAGLTLAEVARQADCAYGLVSFHFGNKDGLLIAAFETLVAQYESLLDGLVAVAGPRATARLDAMVDADFDPRVASAEKVAVWLAFWAEAPRNAAFRLCAADAKRRYTASALALVKEVASDDGSDVDPALVTGGLNAMIDGFWVTNESTGGDAAARIHGHAACRFFLRRLFPKAYAEAASVPKARKRPAKGLAIGKP